MTSVPAGRPGLIAVSYEQKGLGADPVVWSSPDGITWSLVVNDENPKANLDSLVTSVANGPYGLVIVGATGDPGVDAAV